ncbi:MAG: hypothetical protein U0167_15145 [bacterium]
MPFCQGIINRRVPGDCGGAAGLSAPDRSRIAPNPRPWCAANGVDFTDYYPRFMELGKAGVAREYFIPGDAHWNERGHRAVADYFLSYVKNRKP